ncbi:MAG: hypothetical protein FWD74_11305, partial [Actinomycetia bacterium]|nr:hypothetical protein [Actinomycetes bacterium]
MSMVLTGIVFAVVNSRAAVAIPPFPINDSTNGPPGAVDPYWTHARIANTVGNTYTSDGWLRLTGTGDGEATNILNNTPFPSSTGFQVVFDYRQAGGIPFKDAGRTGDGISMYLVDGTQTVHSGGTGAGLGYANGGTEAGLPLDGVCAPGKTSLGVPGGYLGLGLDVFGNYSQSTFGNYGGNSTMGGGIGLRGSGNGACSTSTALTDRQAQYPWVAGTRMNLWTGTSGSTADPASAPDSQYRRVAITVAPHGSNIQVGVAISPLTAKGDSPGALTQAFSANLNNIPGQVPLPATLKLGFAASTGSASDYHDIRYVTVSALTDAAIAKSLSAATPGHAGYPAGTFLPGDPIEFTLTAANNGPSQIGDPPDGVARVYDDMSSLPISGISWECAAAGGAGCVGTGGTGSEIIQDWYGPPGSSVTVTVRGTVTSQSGSFTNTAIIPTDFSTNTLDLSSAFIQKDGGVADSDLTNNTASASFVVADLPASLSVGKSSATASVAKAGDQISYVFDVENTGGVPVTGLQIVDHPVPPAGGLDAPGVACPVTTLPPGGKTQCTGTYTVTQADVDHGKIVDTANAKGKSPGGDPVDSGPSDEVTVPVDGSTGLSVVKSVDAGLTPDPLDAVGQQIHYVFTVTNTGDRTVNHIVVSDEQTVAAGELDAPGVVCPAVRSLAPGESLVCTASYTIAQGDLDAGVVSDVATVTGNGPGGDPIDDVPPSEVVVPMGQRPALSVVKSASPVSVSAVGEVVEYTFAVVNTGNVTLGGVRVTDAPAAPAGALDGPPVCVAASLAPGESTVCAATYTVTQADLDAGVIADTAVAHGVAPDADGETDSGPSTATVGVESGPALSVAKLASPTESASFTAGREITYQFTVTNTGNVTLRDVVIDETGFTGDGPSPVVSCPAGAASLAPGAQVTCVATYTVTQADVDAGELTNAATASGVPPLGPTVTSPPSQVTIAGERRPALSVVKSADRLSVSAVGEVIGYTFTVTNTGNVTVDGIAVADVPVPPAGGLDAPGVVCPGGSLAPGGSMVCAGSYTVTQADMDHGSVSDVATASGTGPGGDPVDSGPSDEVRVEVDQDASLSVVKSVDTALTPDPLTAAGQRVHYLFAVTNTGNVTVDGIAVSDVPVPPAGGLDAPGVVCPGGSLAPGGSMVCAGAYTLTQADVDAGSVSDVATVTGSGPGGDPVDPPSSQVTVDVPPAPGLSVAKSADRLSVSAVGEVIGYTFAVTNTGNVTVDGIAVSDVPVPP